MKLSDLLTKKQKKDNQVYKFNAVNYVSKKKIIMHNFI